MNGKLIQKGIAKRLLSLALVVAMVLSFAPVGAFRASASGDAYTFTSTYTSATGITKLTTKANDDAAESAKGAEAGDTLEFRKANKDAKIDIFVYGDADYPQGYKRSMSGTTPYTYIIPTGYILSEISYADSPSNGEPATFNITLASAADYTLTFTSSGEWTGDLEAVKSAKGGDVIKVVDEYGWFGWLSCYIPSERNKVVYEGINASLAGEFTIPDGYEVKSVTTKTQGSSQVLEIQLQRATIHVSSVSVEPATAEMILGGDTLTLTASVSPDNAANKSVTWASDKPAVATVANGVVTAVAVGEATITATSVDGSLTGSCVVTVTAGPFADYFDFVGSWKCAALYKDGEEDPIASGSDAVAAALNEMASSVTSFSGSDGEYQFVYDSATYYIIAHNSSHNFAGGSAVCYDCGYARPVIDCVLAYIGNNSCVKIVRRLGASSDEIVASGREAVLAMLETMKDSMTNYDDETNGLSSYDFYVAGVRHGAIINGASHNVNNHKCESCGIVFPYTESELLAAADAAGVVSFKNDSYGTLAKFESTGLGSEPTAFSQIISNGKYCNTFNVTFKDSAAPVYVWTVAAPGNSWDYKIVMDEEGEITSVDRGGVVFQPASKGQKIGNSNTYWDLTEGVLTISGTGAMPDFANITDQPWKDVRDSITSIVVESGVTAVGKSAFNYCKKATSVSLPDSLTSLGEYAFSTCSELTTVAVPANVTTIGKSAFDFCTKLTSVNIPDGVTVINEGVFNHCESLTSITIPAGVTAINKNAFAYCYYLRNVVIPSGVTTIGNSAFYYTHYYGATSSITIPASVTSIGANAFDSCSKLTSVTVERITPPTAGTNLFKGITRLATITVPKSAVDAYKAANGWQTYADKIVGADKYTAAEVMALADDAGVVDFVCNGNTLGNDMEVSSFAGKIEAEKDSLVSFVADNAPVYTWNYDFMSLYTYSISVEFDAEGKVISVTYKDDETTDVYVPASKGQKIGNSGTYWDLSEGVLTISGEGAMPDFANTSEQPWKDDYESITSIVVEPGVTAVGKYAFTLCEKATSVSLPDSLTSLGDSAFSTCAELTSIAVPANVTTIGESAFSLCAKLTSVNIPDGVTVINEGVFNQCQALTSITIPAGVTAINKNAFACCYNLKDVVIPSGVTTIGNNAFYLTANSSITIPASVTSIGANAFQSCSKLTSVTVERITPPTAGTNLFKSSNSLATITVPKSAVDAYKAASGWSVYADKIVGAAKYTEAEVMALADDAEVMDFVDAENTTFAALLANMGYVDGSFSGFFDELGAEMVFADTNAPTYVWKDETGMSISVLFDTNNKIQSLTYTLAGEEYTYTPVPELTVGEYNVVVPTGVSALTPDQLAIVPTKVKANLTALETGWYVVNKDVTFTEKLDVKGDVNLILADGCTMTATQLMYLSGGESLTIWGQSAGTGTLSVKHTKTPIRVDTVTINGGTVKADGGDRGIRGKNVTVNAGIVNAKGPIGIHGNESIVINGGIVTAEGTTYALYYTGNPANLTINSALTVMAGTNASSATITSYNGQEYVNIAKGQKLGTSDTYWDLSDGVLTISGTGAMPDFASPEDTPWYESYMSITSVVIESGVTAIGNNAFAADGECNIASVSIGNTVTSIGEFAFYGCNKIQSVTLPDSVTTIGVGAFNSMSALSSVTIPANVTSIGEYAFANGAYTKVTVKATTPPTLGEDAFKDMSGTYVLTKITVPSGTAAAYKAADVWKDYANVITDISHEHSFTYALAEGAADTIVATCGEADCELENSQVSVTLTVGDAADSTTPVTFTKVDGTGTLSSEGLGEPSDFTYDGVAYKVYNAFVPATADSSWNDAMGFVAKLNEAKFEGHSDWQLLSSEAMAKAWKTQFYSTVNYGNINFLWTSVTNDTNAFFFYPGLFGGTMMETSKASTSTNNGFFVLRTAGANVEYTGSAVEAAMDTTDWEAAGLTAPTVSYEAKTGSSLTDTKAVNVGSYTAKITVDTATASVDFTITKVASAVSTTPTAVANLTYTGAAQNLITAGSVAGGTLQYSLDNETYSTTVPQGTDAGDYTVYYKVEGDANHNDSAAANFSVTIAQAAASVGTAPTAKVGLVYSGAAQELVNAGSNVVGGTLQYSLDGINYAAAIPTATAVNNYTVYYKVVGDANHQDTTPLYVTVAIGENTAVNSVISLIDAIGTVEYTSESKQKIDAARAAYNALSAANQTLVTNYTTLTTAEADYKALDAVSCKFEETVKLSEGTYKVYLNAKLAGTYTFESVPGGYAIKDEEGYLTVENGKLTHTQDPAAWMYKNGGLAMTNTYSAKILGIFKASTKVTYYLASATSVMPYVVRCELRKDATDSHNYGPWANNKNGTHTKQCTLCSGIETENCKYDEVTHLCVCGAYDPAFKSVNVSVNVKKATTGRLVKVTTYNYTISTEVVGCKVAAVQYHVTDNLWLTGNSFTWVSKVKKLDIRVIDTDGGMHYFAYDGETGTVTPVTK